MPNGHHANNNPAPASPRRIRFSRGQGKSHTHPRLLVGAQLSGVGRCLQPRWLLFCHRILVQRLTTPSTPTTSPSHPTAPLSPLPPPPSDGTARLWSTDKIFALRMFVGHQDSVDCVW